MEYPRLLVSERQLFDYLFTQGNISDLWSEPDGLKAISVLYVILTGGERVNYLDDSPVTEDGINLYGSIRFDTQKIGNNVAMFNEEVLDALDLLESHLGIHFNPKRDPEKTYSSPLETPADYDHILFGKQFIDSWSTFYLRNYSQSGRVLPQLETFINV